MNRLTRTATLATLLALLGAAVVLAAPAPAQAQDKTFVGKPVVVILAHGPVSSEVIEDMTGTVQALDAVGVTVKVEKRNIVSGGNRRSVEYKATVFVPWTAVLYLKLKE